MVYQAATENKQEDQKKPEKKFNANEAFNADGFAQFFERYADHKEITQDGDVEEIKSRFEIFESLSTVKESMRNLYKKEISEKLGVELDKSDFDHLDEFYENQAVNDPEAFRETMGDIEDFTKLPEQIAKQEAELASFGSKDDFLIKLEELHVKKKNLELSEGNIGLLGEMKLYIDYFTAHFNQNASYLEGNVLSGYDDYKDKVNEELTKVKERKDAVRAVQKEYGGFTGEKKRAKLFEGVVGDIEETEKQFDKIQNLEQMKQLGIDMLEGKKKDLIRGITNIAGLSESIQAKITRQLDRMTKAATVEVFEKGHARFEELAQKSEEYNIELFEGGEKKMAEKMEKGLEKGIFKQIVNVINKANLGTNALTKLEKDLEPILTKKKLGTKEGDELRDFLEASLVRAQDGLDDKKPENRGKWTIISRIIANLKSK